MCERCWTGDPERDAEIAEYERQVQLEREAHFRAQYTPPETMNAKEAAAALKRLNKLLSRIDQTFKHPKSNFLKIIPIQRRNNKYAKRNS